MKSETILISVWATTVVGLLTLSLVVVYNSHYKNITNKCIMEQPRTVLSGSIDRVPPQYRLYLKGKTKETGDDCEVQIRVTEPEYERQIYGRQ